MTNVIRVATQQISGMKLQELSCEAFALRGMQNFSISGLPDSILRDSKDKIRALLHAYVPWDPLQRLVVNLLPPEFNKCGAHLELAIFVASAVALSEELAQSEVLQNNLLKYRFYGGLSLEGNIIPTHESQLLAEEDPHSIGSNEFKSLAELLEALVENDLIDFKKPKETSAQLNQKSALKMPFVEGRYFERLALLCAAILEEPILLVGPPGVGKTYLGQWARHLMPPPQNFGEIKRIWSMAPEDLKEDEAPFLNPHSRAQLSEFVGYRRQNRTFPGYFSLCHKGTLLIDEFPELSRDIREILRNVLDSREIKTLQGRHFYHWPAQFWLIATANPCACGEARPRNLSRCRCSRGQLQSYLQRFSGPLLDRMGIKVFMDIDASQHETKYKITQTLKNLLDHSTPEKLQTFILKIRGTLDQAEKNIALSRNDLKIKKFKTLLNIMGLENTTIEYAIEQWTYSFMSPENFR